MTTYRRRAVAALTATVIGATTLGATTLPVAAASIGAQGFDGLSTATFTTDQLPSGSELTNAGSRNVGGPGLDFTTSWFDTRGEGAGPVTPTFDSSDFIGVNTFGGSNAPDVGPDGTAVGSNPNFEFNDGDGRLELVFEAVDTTGSSGRAVQLSYWINDTGYEADDAFEVLVDDGATREVLLGFGEDDLESGAAPDIGSANWTTTTRCIDGLIADGLGETLSVVVAVDTNSSSENVFVDDVAVLDGVAADDCDTGVVVEPALELTIPEIQGASHRSPVEGADVVTTGVVTAVGFGALYVQDPDGDGDDATSDAILVSQPVAVGPPAQVGDLVSVAGTVSEFVPGGTGTGNLPTTNLFRPDVTVLGDGGPVTPVVIGPSGRLAPQEVVISDDETPISFYDPAQDDANTFDPAEDALDFYEALEAMLVTVEDPVTVSATRTFSPFASEVFTVPAGGAVLDGDDVRTDAGGVLLGADVDNRGDQQPERVQLQFDGTLYPAPVPELRTGELLDDVTGVVGYSFGNFEVNATEAVTVVGSAAGPDAGAITPEPTSRVRVASYNVLNLSPDATDDAQRAEIARQVVDELASPDVLALQEIQDDSGEVDDGTTSADETLSALADAIVAAGGPAYTGAQIALPDGETGGVPGGNIRNAFLYDASRVDLVDLELVTEDVLTAIGSDDPTAFEGSRRPLAGTFVSKGRSFTVISNHFSSRFGSTPIFGAIQPFVQAGEDERAAQSRATNDYVDALVAGGRDDVVVVGDLNTFEFTDELLEDLPGTGAERVLTNVTAMLPRPDRYSFIFDGNSQALDHAFVTDGLLSRVKADYVHVNVDFPRTAGNVVGSDHDPILLELKLDGRKDVAPGRGRR